MKYFIILILTLLVLISCSPVPFYSSKAGKPISSKTIITDMVLVDTFIDPDTKSFSVIACKDSGKGKDIFYLLLANNKTFAVKSIKDVILNRSVTLSPDRTKEFISVLDQVRKVNPDNYQKKNAKMYEYIVSTEENIKQVSENVQIWESNLSFNASINDETCSIVLILGDNSINKNILTFKKVGDLDSLIIILESGLAELSTMGYK